MFTTYQLLQDFFHPPSIHRMSRKYMATYLFFCGRIWCTMILLHYPLDESWWIWVNYNTSRSPESCGHKRGWFPESNSHDFQSSVANETIPWWGWSTSQAQKGWFWPWGKGLEKWSLLFGISCTCTVHCHPFLPGFIVDIKWYPLVN